ncbi:MAG: cupin domain-containing protein [Granulosicoccus sp.]
MISDSKALNSMKISTENAEHYQWGKRCDGWHLVKTSTLSVISERVPAGCKESRHFHQYSEQFFFVLSGVATLEVNGQTHFLESQQGLHIEAGLPHQLRNDQKDDLVFLVTSVPPSHGDRIQVEI